MARFAQEARHYRREEKISLKPPAPNVTLLHKLAGFVGAGYLHLVAKTSAIHAWDHPKALALRRDRKRVIYTFWHNAQVFLAYAHRDEAVNIIVSRSKDGEYIAQVMARMGLNAVRGSTSRGGEQALRDLCDLLKDGKQVGFTPDGPRGPLQTVHGGVVLAAQISGAPVLPVAYVASRRIVFRSWDRFVLPLPFSSIIVGHGEPFLIDKDMPLEQAKEKVRQALNRIVEQSEEAAKTLPRLTESLVGYFFEKIYTLLTLVALPLVLPFGMFRYGAKRTFRFLVERVKVRVPDANGRRRLWLHAASIGEWQALKPVLARLKKISNFDFVITVSTPEARALVHREEPSAAVRMLPVDVPWVLSRAVREINPSAVAIVETELWPNLLSTLYARSVPVFLINGRLSERSQRHWLSVKPFAQRLLRAFSAFFVRTDVDGRRFVQIGAPVPLMTITGNTKVDNLTVSLPDAAGLEAKRARRKELFGDDEGVLIAAGSTWGGEEKALLGLFAEKNPKRLRLLLAPRRLERCAEVTRLLEKIPASWSLWSKVKATRVWETDILLVDTLGDLKELLRVADIGFVGGSLVPRGGQNPLEAAAAGIPVLFGPSMENFHEEAAHLKRAGGARQARDAKDVLMDIRELSNDDDMRHSAGQAAARSVTSIQGASDATAAALANYLS